MGWWSMNLISNKSLVSQMRTRILFVALLGLGLFFFCQRSEKKQSPVVASTGNKNLYLSDLQEFLPDSAGVAISKVQIQTYIQRWANREVIYQQAVAERFDKRPDIQRKIKALEKEYVVATYVDEKVTSQIKVSQDEINRFYEDNLNEFIREKDYYNVMVMLLENSTLANQVRRDLINGEDFETLARQQSLDVYKDRGGNLGWVTIDELPEDIASRITRQQTNTVSRPIRTPVGYYLVKLNGVRNKGETQILEEVQDIIVWRIKATKREAIYQELINQLIEKAGLSINWSFLDSLKLVN